jgi:hypothetical protein
LKPSPKIATVKSANSGTRAVKAELSHIFTISPNKASAWAPQQL